MSCVFKAFLKAFKFPKVTIIPVKSSLSHSWYARDVFKGKPHFVQFTFPIGLTRAHLEHFTRIVYPHFCHSC